MSSSSAVCNSDTRVSLNTSPLELPKDYQQAIAEINKKFTDPDRRDLYLEEFLIRKKIGMKSFEEKGNLAETFKVIELADKILKKPSTLLNVLETCYNSLTNNNTTSSPELYAKTLLLQTRLESLKKSANSLIS